MVSFLDVDPRSTMTEEEVQNFEEIMAPHNTDKDPSQVKLSPFVSVVADDLDQLFFGKGVS